MSNQLTNYAYDSSSDDSSDDESSDDESDSIYTSKQNNNVPKGSYDGLTHTEICKYEGKANAYVRADCCGLFFLENAFYHHAKGYSIPGMITCIHCFIALNTHRFKSNVLDPNDKILLVDYIGKFAPTHDEKKCTRIAAYGNCFLCDDILNIVPKQINENDKTILIDKTIVKKSNNARLFTLSI